MQRSPEKLGPPAPLENLESARGPSSNDSCDRITALNHYG
jgi:hypothetical protein